MPSKRCSSVQSKKGEVRHHSGYDVTQSKDELERFQIMALEKVAGNVPSGRPPKRSKTVAGTRLTNEEEQALADAIAAGERAALNKEVCRSLTYTVCRKRYFPGSLASLG